MKRFLIRILLFVVAPLGVLLAVYLLTDPFKTLRPFSLQYFDVYNREYQSFELFLKNDPQEHYNAFIIGSSRCGGFNTYHWRRYLPEGAKPYMFQAWSESLTGMEQKIDFLDQHGHAIDNALVLIDIPNSFAENQLPKEVESIKHYCLSGQQKWLYQAYLFLGFIQKPSQWIGFIKDRMHPFVVDYPCDPITNDYYINNQHVDIYQRPPQDSLKDCSSKTRSVFFNQSYGKTDADLIQTEPLIDKAFLAQLQHIKAVFDRHHTDYRIVISPMYCYTHPCINTEDLQVLKGVFGEDRVFNYSSKNALTTDYNDYYDPEHFGSGVGWQIIEDIYNK